MPFSAGTIAHELGHNLGRLHAPCGNPGGPDPNYPHAGATLGSTGYDLLTGVLRSPSAYRDYMSYCTPRWTSDYTYGAIVQWRRGDPHAQPSPPQASGRGPRTDGLLVWGRIGAGAVRLNPAFALEAAPALPSGGGPNQLRALAADGSEVFRLAFEAVPVADATDPSERHFAFFVPLDRARIATVSRIELATPAGTAVREAAPAPAPAAEVLREAVPGDEVRLRWDDARYPAALVRDAVTGEVLAFGRGGEVRLIARGQLEILVSDGVRSRTATIR
jgi:hypothetical protein